MADQDVVLINWCWRQQGLMVAPDNPFGIRSLDDLFAGSAGTRPGMGRRSAGAGSRELFDRLLGDWRSARGEAPPSTWRWTTSKARTMRRLAVRLGQVDAVFGAQSAAESIGLGFVPVIRERVDLLVNRRSYFEPPLQMLLAFCRNENVRRPCPSPRRLRPRRAWHGDLEPRMMLWSAGRSLRSA